MAANAEYARLMAVIGADISDLKADLKVADSMLKQFAAGSRTTTGGTATGAKQAGMSFDQMSNRMFAMAGTASMVMGTLYSFKKVLDFGAEWAQIENMSASFEDMAQRAGSSSDVLMASMQAASRGMLGETELIRRWNQTYLLAGEDIATRMPELIKVATASAAAGMGEMSSMLESLVLGLGRLQPEIIDNLGFSVKLGDVQREAAASTGKRIEDLTKEDQQVAMLAKVLELATDRFGDLDEAAARMAGKGMAQAGAAVSEFADYVKTGISPTIDSVVGGVGRAIAEATPGSRANIEGMMSDLEKMSRFDQLGILEQANWKFDPVTASAALVEDLTKVNLTTEDRARILEALTVIDARYGQEAITHAMALRDATERQAQADREAARAAEEKARAQNDSLVGDNLLTPLRDMQMEIGTILDSPTGGEGQPMLELTRREVENLMTTMAGLTLTEQDFAQVQMMVTHALGRERAEVVMSTFAHNNAIAGVNQLDVATMGLAGQFGRMTQAAFKGTDALVEQHNILATIGPEAYAATYGIDALADAMGWAKGEAISLSGALNSLMAPLGGLGGATQLMDTLGGLRREGQLSRARAMAASAGIDKPLLNQYMTNDMDMLEKAQAYASYTRDMNQYNEQQAREAWDAQVQGANKAGSAVNDLQQQMESYYESWQGLVNGVFQPTTSFDATSAMDATGQHQNTWDEQARRMEDVYNRGAESPWMPADWAQLPAEQIRGLSAQWLDEFYMGLKPEAVDWDAVMAAINEEATRSAGMENLYSQAQAMAVEAGLGPDNPAIARMFGMEMPASGMEAADGIYGGLIRGLSKQGDDVGEAFKTYWAEPAMAAISKRISEGGGELLQVLLAAILAAAQENKSNTEGEE